MPIDGASGVAHDPRLPRGRRRAAALARSRRRRCCAACACSTMAGELLDDSDTLELAAEQAGLPVAELAAYCAEPEVEQALRADMRAARSPRPRRARRTTSSAARRGAPLHLPVVRAAGRRRTGRPARLPPDRGLRDGARQPRAGAHPPPRPRVRRRGPGLGGHPARHRRGRRGLRPRRPRRARGAGSDRAVRAGRRRRLLVAPSPSRTGRRRRRRSSTSCRRWPVKRKLTSSANRLTKIGTIDAGAHSSSSCAANRKSIGSADPVREHRLDRQRPEVARRRCARSSAWSGGRA